MKINILVDNDKCWSLNIVRKLIPYFWMDLWDLGEDGQSHNGHHKRNLLVAPVRVHRLEDRAND